MYVFSAIAISVACQAVVVRPCNPQRVLLRIFRILVAWSAESAAAEVVGSFQH